MFQTSYGPSSGSHELLVTDVVSFGSVLAFAACADNVWLHILTLGVCAYCTGQSCNNNNNNNNNNKSITHLIKRNQC
jgi:hypothetical protein